MNETVDPDIVQTAPLVPSAQRTTARPELAVADQALAVLDVGMGNHEIGHDAARFARRGNRLVVMDRGADAQAADDADARHVNPS